MVEQTEIVDAVMIDDQCAGHGTEIDQVMPATVVPGQTGCFKRQYGCYLA